MQRLVIFALALLTAGCAAPPEKEAISTPAPPPILKMERLDLDTGRTAFLLNEDDKQLKVGAELDDVTELFPKPKGASGFSDLPPRLDPKLFDAWGWQANDNSGFGAILDRQSKRVALAMVMIKDQAEGHVTALVDRYSSQLPKDGPDRTEGNDLVKFYFWELGKDRLMINSVTNRRGGYNVTIMAGDKAVLEAVGANPSTAKAAVEKAGEALRNGTNSSTSPN